MIRLVAILERELQPEVLTEMSVPRTPPYRIVELEGGFPFWCDLCRDTHDLYCPWEFLEKQETERRRYEIVKLNHRRYLGLDLAKA